MPEAEKKVINWLEEHLSVILFICITLLSAYVRIVFRSFLSGDMKYFFIPWYSEIKDAGGLMGGLDRQVGDYNLFYQFLIAIMTYLPVKPHYAYKIFSICFDYLLAGIVSVLVYQLSEEEKKMKAVLAYGAVLMLPTVLLNSAMWGQCDSVYVCFIAATFLCLFQGRYKTGFILYGIAFAFKLQAIFALPFVLFFYFVKKKFSVLHFLLIPAALCVSGLPGCLLGGRNIFDVFTVYIKQKEYSTGIYINYPSFWVFLNPNGDLDYKVAQPVMMMFTVMLLALFMSYILLKKYELSDRSLIYVAFMTSYTTVLFLPGMRERYGYLYEILSIVLAIWKPVTIPLVILLQVVSLCTYGHYFFLNEINMPILSAVNLMVWVCYLMMSGRLLAKKCKGVSG